MSEENIFRPDKLAPTKEDSHVWFYERWLKLDGNLMSAWFHIAIVNKDSQSYVFFNGKRFANGEYERST
jgi:hypothetical protein